MALSKKLPKQVDEAVDRLSSELSLHDKSMIANMSEDELIDLQFSLGEYIRSEFRLFENKGYFDRNELKKVQGIVFRTNNKPVMTKERQTTRAFPSTRPPSSRW